MMRIGDRMRNSAHDRRIGNVDLRGYDPLRQKWTKLDQEFGSNTRSSLEPIFESRTLIPPDGARPNSTQLPL
jgi:hypothetical protein